MNMKKLLGLLAFITLLSVAPASAVTCTWQGGTAAWDNANTASWSCAHVPTTADDVVLDGTSGGGIVTVNSPNGAGVVTVQSITFGAFTGTLDFSANNNNVTVTATSAVTGSGAGVRTFNMGNGTWTLSSVQAIWSFTTTTSLTFNANSSTISFAGAQFLGGGLTYNNVNFTSAAGPTTGKRITVTGANTFNAWTIGAGERIILPNAVTQTATSMSVMGTALLPSYLYSVVVSSAATISVASGTVNMNYCFGIADITGAGGATFTAINSYNGGGVTNITITQPSFGGARGLIVGG